MIPIAINDVPISCINSAAILYKIPATIIISILKKENGRNGQMRKNKNGSYDYGPFQINSIWLKEIAPFDITKEDIQYNPCINAMVGTWILAKGLAHGKNAWDGIGRYHSHTLKFSDPYQLSVRNIHNQISQTII